MDQPFIRDLQNMENRGGDLNRLSSVMILLYRENDEWKFPLIQRPEYDGVHSGQMALPGGRSEEHDRDRIETALRETREEIGIGTEKVEIVGKLTELPVIASRNTVLPVVGYLDRVPEYRPDPEEVDSVHVVGLKEIMNNSAVKTTDISVGKGISIRAPYYDVNGKTVWGATAMILSEFLYIVRKIKLNH